MNPSRHFTLCITFNRHSRRFRHEKAPRMNFGFTSGVDYLIIRQHRAGHKRSDGWTLSLCVKMRQHICRDLLQGLGQRAAVLPQLQADMPHAGTETLQRHGRIFIQIEVEV